jgi:hypothetical protein
MIPGWQTNFEDILEVKAVFPTAPDLIVSSLGPVPRIDAPVVGRCGVYGESITVAAAFKDGQDSQWAEGPFTDRTW